MKLPDKVYNVLKWVTLFVLPALATFYATVGKAWGLPYIEPVCTTLTALATLIGTIIGISHITIKRENKMEEKEEE